VVPLKVQLAEDDLELIDQLCSTLKYRSRSEYLREAIRTKIESDRSRIREIKRQEAMKAYGHGHLEDVFEGISGEDFEDR
jgi:Arc/MetJ-type ribon-helix-helix transcriptional regulator